MESMIEHSITIKIASVIAKGLLWIGVALGISPVMDFIILQADNYSILSPLIKAFLDDLKIIFGALVPVLVAIKIFYEIKKVKKKK